MTPIMDGVTDPMGVEEGEVKVLACKLCPKQYFGKNKFVKHMKDVHLDTKQYNCDEYSKIFTSARTFYNHRRCHQSFQCFKCDKNLARSKKASHIRRCQGVKDKVKRCHFDDCDYTTKKLSNLKTHIESHRQIFCDVDDYGKEFHGRKKLYVHHRRVHKPVTVPRVCPKEEPKKKPKVHRCGWCNYETIYTTHLRDHEKSCKVRRSKEPPILLVL